MFMFLRLEAYILYITYILYNLIGISTYAYYNVYIQADIHFKEIFWYDYIFELKLNRFLIKVVDQ